MDVAQLGIKIDSTGAVKAVSDLDRLTASAGKADSATERLATTSVGAARGFGQGGQGARQMALQLSQVAQQGAVTGNYLQALAVQLPDMATGFGAVGIAAGVVAGVALPLLVSAFTGATQESRTFTAALTAFEDSLSGTKEIAKIMLGDLDALAERFGGLGRFARELANAEAQAGLRTLADNTRILKDEIVGLYDGAIFPQTSRAEDLANGLRLGTKASNELADSLLRLRDAGTLNEQLSAATNLRRSFEQMVGPVGQMTAAQYQFWVKVKDAEAMLQQAKLRTNELSGAVNMVAGAFDAVNSRIATMGAGIKTAATDAWDMAKGLYEAAKTQAEGMAYVASNQQGGAGYMANQYAQYGAGRAAGEKLANNGFTLPSAPGSAGGGGADPFQARLDALRTSLASEAEIEMAAYTQQQDTLKTALEQRAITQNEYYTMMEAAAQAHQDAMAGIDVYRYGTTLQKTSSFLGDMAGALQGGNEKMLDISKKFGAAQALVNTFTGATEALKLPFPANLAAFAKVVATGLSAVAAIKGGSSSISGGNSVAAQAVPATQAPQPVQYTIKGIDKDEFYSGRTIAKIFDGISEEAGKRGMATFQFV